MKPMRWICVLLALALLPSRALAQAGEAPEPVPPTTEITEVIPSEEPVYAPDPVQPEEPAASEEPVPSEEPFVSEAPVEPAEPSEPMQPSGPPVPVPSEDPAETALPSEPAEPVESTDPAEAASAEPADSSQPEEISQDIVRVVVPGYGRIVINPYGLPTMLEDGTESRDQIVSTPTVIANYGAEPVRMEVQVSQLILGEDTVLVPQPPALLAEDKQLFLYAEFQPALDETGTALWAEGYIGAPNQLLVLGETPFSQEVLTLPAAADMPGLGAFRFFGAASGGPDEPWDSADALHLTLTFTFTPMGETDLVSEPGTDPDAVMDPWTVPEPEWTPDPWTEPGPQVSTEPEWMPGLNDEPEAEGEHYEEE